MQIFSGLSIFGCCAIICICLFFSEFRKYRHVEIVFYVAINELVASVGTVMGYLNNGTVGCWYQGVTSNYNYLSAAMWTTVISWQLMCIVNGGRKIDDFTWFHVVCWGFPVITTTLVLTTNTYGNAAGGSGWCFIGKRESSPSWGVEFWEIMSYYLWLWLCIVTITIFYIRIIMRVYAMGLNSTSKTTARNLKRFTVYPLILIVCWLVNTVQNISAQGGNNSRGFAAVLPTLEGFLNFLAFYFTNRKIRKDVRKAIFNSAPMVGVGRLLNSFKNLNIFPISSPPADSSADDADSDEDDDESYQSKASLVISTPIHGGISSHLSRLSMSGHDPRMNSRDPQRDSVDNFGLSGGPGGMGAIAEEL